MGADRIGWLCWAQRKRLRGRGSEEEEEEEEEEGCPSGSLRRMELPSFKSKQQIERVANSILPQLKRAPQGI